MVMRAGWILLIGLFMAVGANISAEPWSSPVFTRGALSNISSGSGAAMPLPSGQAWYCFANHTHTTHSDGYASVEERIKEAAKYGADSVSITDHRTLTQCSDSGFGTYDNCQPMCGEEWGGHGHVGMLNIAPGEDMEGWSWETALPAALARGATVIANHPKNLESNPWPIDNVDPGVQGVEVWSAVFTATGSAEALLWWGDFLAKGRQLFAIGGSDNHLYDWMSTSVFNSLTPCNYVLAAGADPDSLQAGIDAGRISITGKKGGGRCYLWADGGNDGTYETLMGGNVVVTAAATVRIRAEVYDGSGLDMYVISGTGESRYEVGEGSPWIADFQMTAGASTKDFVWVELRGLLNATEAISNPIYINCNPEDADGDGALDTLEFSHGTDMYDPDSDDDGVSDGYEIGFDGDPLHYNPYNRDTNPTGTDMDANALDTDGDMYDDLTEVMQGTNPLRKSIGVFMEIENIPFVVTDNTTAPEPGAHLLDEGSNAPITAVAAAGWRFDHWDVEPVSAAGVADPYSVSTTVLVDQNKVVRAVFVQAPEEGEGSAEGLEGQPEGAPEGLPEGMPEGMAEGAVEGSAEGEGVQEGEGEAAPEGEGTIEGIAEGEGQLEGIEEGEGEGLPWGDCDLFIAAGGLPAAIQDRGTTVYTLTIPEHRTITDVNVQISLAHAALNQLSAILRSPTGVDVFLFVTPFLSGTTMTDTEFDDDAAMPISEASAPYTGTYQPFIFLYTLNGLDMQGTWELRITDNLTGGTGTLDYWALSFNPCPEEGEGVIEGAPEGTTEGEGAIEGIAEGISEGEGVAEGISEGEGIAEGISEGGGAEEGVLEGIFEGEGVEEGILEGLPEGIPEGIVEGIAEGISEGAAEGVNEGEGLEEGTAEGIFEGEGAPEGVTEGITEGNAEGADEGEGILEGQPEAEGSIEGDGEELGPHSADQDGNYIVSLTELLRVIQFFNTHGYHCAAAPNATEDGYMPGLTGDHSCGAHSGDYNPQNWEISLTELLRLIQFFNSGGYHACPLLGTEDGYCPGRPA